MRILDLLSRDTVQTKVHGNIGILYFLSSIELEGAIFFQAHSTS